MGYLPIFLVEYSNHATSIVFSHWREFLYRSWPPFSNQKLISFCIWVILSEWWMKMEAYVGFCFAWCFRFRQGEYVFKAWKYLETSSGRLMGTVEELLFGYYHRNNATCLSLCWIWTRKSWRSFCVALRVLFLARNFINRVTCVQISSVLLSASALSLLFIYCWISLDSLFLAVISIVTTAVTFFMEVSVTIGSVPERSRSSVIMSLEPELSRLGSWNVVSCLLRQFGKP